MASVPGSESPSNSIEVPETLESANKPQSLAPLDEFECPVCFGMIKEAYITFCGHTFCHNCIKTCIEQTGKCPVCVSVLRNDQISPNFLLNKLLEKLTNEIRPRPTKAVSLASNQLVQVVMDRQWQSQEEISTMLQILQQKQMSLEREEKEFESQVLYDFLEQTQAQKEQELQVLQTELQFLKNDLASIAKVRQQLEASDTVPVFPSSLGRKRPIHELEEPSATPKSFFDTDRLQAKKKMVHDHLEDLQQCYFATCNKYPWVGLKHFSKNLSKFTRHSRFRVVTTLKYGEIFNRSSIVSSIEFDRDDQYFATGGVTKKIKIFEFNNLQENLDRHFPICEMSCKSKISCLSWNTYFKSRIASSDYEGGVCLWDINEERGIGNFDGHEKRVWSIDFSHLNPTLLASGSDDAKVKVWCTNQQCSVTSIESKGNICSVKFNPFIANQIAFGSADHQIHYYDLRNTSVPLFVLGGHKKAVSYIQFLNQDEIISASIDSSLQLWNISDSSAPVPVRTYKGHLNEKNFVGLSCCGDYIACGSENNSVYAYYKDLSKPAFSFKFDEDVVDDGSTPPFFVSSVCWKKSQNILLAANSQGTVKVLELV